MAPRRDRRLAFLERLLADVAVPLLAVLVALAIGALFVLAIGANPVAVYAALFRGTFGSAYGIGQVLFKATPLVFTGLAVAIAFRAGLFNIGAQGQLEVGAFTLAATGAMLPPAWPAWAIVGTATLAGAAAGAIWAAIPGALKARFGAHEVITTLMLNFVAVAATNYFLTGPLGMTGTMHTRAVPAGLDRLDTLVPALSGSPVNMSLFIALGAALAVCVLLWWTSFGYELRAVGLAPGTAAYAGMSVGGVTIAAMALSGALAGLGGTNAVLGYKSYFEEGMTGGAGFMGIAVALLGRNHPVGVVLAALLFGALSYGGLVINGMVPKELIDILQAVVILNVVVASTVFGGVLTTLRKRRLAAA